jgi:hypothetical protein
MADVSADKGRAPVDILTVVGGAVTVLGVLAAGAGLSRLLPEPSVWLTAAAYAAPASLAFAAYWWVAQKL